MLHPRPHCWLDVDASSSLAVYNIAKLSCCFICSWC